MALFEILNTSFFISLAILLLVSGLIIFYMNLRINQQDHKISSMLGLISTMAEEVNFVRNKGYIPTNNNDINSSVINLRQDIPSLIEVSDNEDDEDEDEDEDDEDDDEDEYDNDYVEDGEEEEEVDQEEDNKEKKNSTNEEEDRNIKKLNINLGQNISEIINISSQINNLTNIPKENYDIESVDDDDFDDETIDSNQTKCIKIINQENLNLENTFDSDNKDLFNNINIPGIIDENIHSFKNMSVQKLRSIVVEKGLLNNNDSIKLKKHDLLKMLNC
jgi:hypothetical protein